jgi:EAL domain-containing protein (putative c-di-GMP-specific phosphodiesterase class I)/GGDEF domain-containing protein
MSLSPTPSSDALLGVIMLRHTRLSFRLALVGVTLALSVPIIGWTPAGCWLLPYAAIQLGEVGFARGTKGLQRLSAWQAAVAAALLFAGNLVFAALGMLHILAAAPWGLATACLIWTGAFAQRTVDSANSRMALIVSAAPYAVCFLGMPWFVVQSGGRLSYGLVILAGGFINVLATAQAWIFNQLRLEAASRERLANHVAHHDPETGLPNRLAFEEAIAAQAGRERTLVVALLGINRFADLRAAMGYALIVRLIRNVTARIEGAHPGLVAQLSANTLGVIFHAEDPAEARAYAARLQAAMVAPIVVDGIDVDVSFTIGLAAATDNERASLLLKHASIALDVAFKTGISVNVFDPSLDSNPAGNLSLMSDMLKSIENGEITNHYQPKYDLRSGRPVAVEALVRWHHPERGSVPPDRFIPMAEETGRIRELTLDVLARAVQDQAWLAARGHTLAFAVNLSGRLLHDPEIIQTIIDIARPAVGKIRLEVTETAVMEYPDIALELLRQLKSAGIGISIDDYGSGLSSLAYLKNIPADELKIDRSFVAQMDRSREDCILVRSTIALAHSFGLTVVAEGVEAQATLGFLKAMNCDLAQGYYMGRPMPIDRLNELLANGAELHITPTDPFLEPAPV